METKFLEIRSLIEPGPIEDSMFDLGQDGFELKETTPIFVNSDRTRNVTCADFHLARFMKSKGKRYLYLADHNQRIPNLVRGTLATTLSARLAFFERAGFNCVTTISRTQISGNSSFHFFGTDCIRMIYQKQIEPAQWEALEKETGRLLASEKIKTFYEGNGGKLKLAKQKRPSWLDVKYDEYHASYMESWNEFLALLIAEENLVKANNDNQARDLAVALGVREGCDCKRTIFSMLAILEGFEIMNKSKP
jgi:hypothetical protein